MGEMKTSKDQSIINLIVMFNCVHISMYILTCKCDMSMDTKKCGLKLLQFILFYFIYL